MVAVCGDNSLEKRSSYNVIYDVFPLNLGLNVMKRKDTTKLSLPILISSWCALCEHFPRNCITWEPAANSAINTNPYCNIHSCMRPILAYRRLIFFFHISHYSKKSVWYIVEDNIKFLYFCFSSHAIKIMRGLHSILCWL